MLKTEIRGLYQEKKESRKQVMSKEKSTLLLERKYIIAKEMLEKLQEEKVKLLKSNFDLKRRSDTLEVKFNELKTQSKSSVRGRSSTTHQPGSR